MGQRTSAFNSRTTADVAINGVDLTGKYIIVTGSNTGIGKETARVLVQQNATVIMACRSPDRAEEARKDIINALLTDPKFEGKQSLLEERIKNIPLDLGSLKSINEFAKTYVGSNQPLHYLINNAGVMAIPEFRKTTEGFEMQFGTNHIGHFYLTMLLTPLLKKSAPSRVINVSSGAHRNGPNPFGDWVAERFEKVEGPSEANYRPFTNYGISKGANILFAREYNRRFSGDRITAVSLHPGVIPTELTRHNALLGGLLNSIGKYFVKSIPQGAATTVRCVSLTDEEIKGGHYYSDCQEANGQLRNDFFPETNVGNNESSQEKLWILTEKLIEKAGFSLSLDQGLSNQSEVKTEQKEDD